MIEHKFETKFKVGDVVIVNFDGKPGYGIVDRIEISIEMFEDVKRITNNRYFISKTNNPMIQRTFKESEIFGNKQEFLEELEM